MVAFIVFWAALFCIIFFLLETMFKFLSSVFTGLIVSGTGVIAIGILIALGEATLFGIFSIANVARTEGVDEVIIQIVILVVELLFIGGLIGGIGTILYEIAVVVGQAVIVAVSVVLSVAAEICETAYAHFLSVIIKHLDIR